VAHLVEMQREYGERGLMIIGVTKASKDDASAFATKYGATYPIRGDAADIFKKFGVTWIPSTKLIAPDGRIVHEERFSRLEPSSTDLKVFLHGRLPKT